MLFATCPPAGQAPAVRDLLAELDAEELLLRVEAALAEAPARFERRIESIRLERALLLAAR